MPSQPRLKSGHTLVEALVTTALFGMLFGIVIAVYVVTSRAVQRTSDESSVQQQMQILISTLQRELGMASRSSFSSNATPVALAALLPSTAFDASAVDGNTGQTSFDRYVVYYLDPTTQIAYRRYLPLTTDAIQRSRPTTVDVFIGTDFSWSNLARGGTRVANSITSWSARMVNLYVAEIHITGAAPDGRSYDFQSSVFFRN